MTYKPIALSGRIRNEGFYLTHTDGMLLLGIAHPDADLFTIARGTVGLVPDNGWHHIVVTGDGKNIRFIVDGAYDNSIVPIKGLQEGLPSNPMYIGAFANLNEARLAHLAGALGRSQFYNTTLTETEAASLSQGNPPIAVPHAIGDGASSWGNLTHYDYGFRVYNPVIGKFLSVDPLAREYPMLIPYQFASNTPIRAVDLNGLEARS